MQILIGDRIQLSRPLHVSINRPFRKEIAPYSYLSCHLSHFGRCGEILILLPFGPSLSSTLLSKGSLLSKLLMNLQVVYGHWGYVKPPVDAATQDCTCHSLQSRNDEMVDTGLCKATVPSAWLLYRLRPSRSPLDSTRHASHMDFIQYTFL